MQSRVALRGPLAAGTANGRVQAVLVAALAAAASAVVGYAMSTGHGPMLLALLVAAPAVAYAVTKPWGSVAVVGPAFLVPFPPSIGPLDPGLVVAGPTLVLAGAYWWLGAGRPPISRLALGAVVILLVASPVLSFRTPGATGLIGSVGDPLMWVAGIILGASVARTPAGLWALVLLCVPLGAVAALEALGVSNPWDGMVGADPAYAEKATREGVRRSTSSFGHPLVAGAMLLAPALLVIHLRGRVTVRFVLAAFLMGAALATVSRSALLGLAGGILVLVIQFARSPRQLVALIAVFAVAGWGILQVPAVSESFTNRVSNTTEQQNVREFAIRETVDDLKTDPQSLLFGGGVGESKRRLTAEGGIQGYVIYDDQYITWLRDFGLVVVAIVFAMLMAAIWRAAPSARRAGAPAAVAIALVLVFVDGMYWSSLGLLGSVILGLLTARVAGPGLGPNRRSSVGRLVRRRQAA